MLKYMVAGLALAFASPALADDHDEPPLRVEVLRTSAGSLHVNSALIMGERDAVLVDPPFTLADAHRVAAMVLDSFRTWCSERDGARAVFQKIKENTQGFEFPY